MSPQPASFSSTVPLNCNGIFLRRLYKDNTRQDDVLNGASGIPQVALLAGDGQGSSRIPHPRPLSNACEKIGVGRLTASTKASLPKPPINVRQIEIEIPVSFAGQTQIHAVMLDLGKR